MYTCPSCLSRNVSGRIRCECGADLSLLRFVDGLAEAWFDRAIAALSEGAPGRALEWLSACCAVQPNDAAARRAQAKVWAQLGRWGEARDALERARLLDPAAPELAEIQAALDEARQPAAAAPPAQAPRNTAKQMRKRRGRAGKGGAKKRR